MSRNKRYIPPKERKCKIKGCDGKRYSLGFCSKHYSQYNRKKITMTGRPIIKKATQPKPEPDPAPAKAGRKPMAKCKEEGCKEIVAARGLCIDHYRYRKTHGDSPKREKDFDEPGRMATVTVEGKISARDLAALESMATAERRTLGEQILFMALELLEEERLGIRAQA